MGLKEARAELAELVDQALPGTSVYRTVPERLTPPVAIVRPADDYVSPAGTFDGDQLAQLEVVLVARTGRNNLASDELDDMIDAVITGLHDSETVWDAPVVKAPFVTRIGEANFLACTLQTACVYSTT